MKEKELVTVRNYSVLLEAQMAQMTLEAHGIDSELFDQNIVAVYSIITHAVGGVRLMVAAENAEQAQEILARDEEARAESREAVTCPKCGSDDIYYERPGILLTIIFILLMGIPFLFLQAKKLSCGACGHEWRQKIPG